MNYSAMLVSLCLATFLAANASLTLIAIIVWRMARKRLSTCPAGTRSRMLFLLGATPTPFAFLIVATLVVPSFLTLEPRSTLEVPGISLTILALLSLSSIAWTILQSIKRWRTTRHLVNEWKRAGQRVSFEDVDATCYRIEHPFPLVAVVGAFRPGLFIANQVADSLTERELKAAMCHENGHLSYKDNLRRWTLAVCSDLLPGLSPIKNEWSLAAEIAADQCAAEAGNAVDLASALVRIARMVPNSAKLIVPSGALLVDQDESALASRVELLLADGSMSKGNETQNLSLLTIPFSLWVGTACLAVLLAGTRPGLLRAIHAILEHVVEALK